MRLVRNLSGALTFGAGFPGKPRPIKCWPFYTVLVLNFFNHHSGEDFVIARYSPGGTEHPAIPQGPLCPA
jgi:hypothetical protein